jgi:hypothetical protein
MLETLLQIFRGAWLSQSRIASRLIHPILFCPIVLPFNNFSLIIAVNKPSSFCSLTGINAIQALRLEDIFTGPEISDVFGQEYELREQMHYIKTCIGLLSLGYRLLIQ